MRAFLVMGVVLGLCDLGKAQDKGQAAEEKRLPLARLYSPIGTLLVRDPGKQTWNLPSLYDAIGAGDTLVTLPGAKAVLDLKEGDVRLTLLGDLPALSATPVLETAGILHRDKDFDLDLTFDRGRIVVETRKEKGPARLRIRLGQTRVLATLEPGARFAVERFGSWRPGVPFLREPKKGHAPDTHVIFLVPKGKVEVEFQEEKHALQGPVLYHWSSHGGVHGPVPLKKMPLWLAGGDPSAQATAWYAAVEVLRRKIAEKKELASFAPIFLKPTGLKGEVTKIHAAMVYSAGALDEPALVLEALHQGKKADTREAAVLQLRSWSARHASHDRRLYDLLKKDFTAGEAENFVGLLHSFGERDLARPETYEVLIDYLGSKKAALRELAIWNLQRLVPQGRKIGFDAAASLQERAQAQAAWRKLIPAGKFPPLEK